MCLITGVYGISVNTSQTMVTCITRISVICNLMCMYMKFKIFYYAQVIVNWDINPDV